MNEIINVSFSDVLGDEVGNSQIKAELDITSESEMYALSDASMQEALDESLGDKSHYRYVHAYEALTKWQESKEITSFAEPVLLDYFRELSEKYKPSSSWSTYSMLKSKLNSNHNINISGYKRLNAFLKEIGDGFQSKKSKVFTAEDVNKFLTEASDDEYLAMKTVLVFEVIGANSTDKITNVKTDHVEDNGNEIIVRIHDPKTKVLKAHVVGGPFAEIVRKYMKLRQTVSTERFFMQYRSGKCLNQPMSRRYIGKIPKEIAKFLKLPECEAYTGYTFRSTSTTVSDDTGVAIDTVKRQRRSRIAEDTSMQGAGALDETLAAKSHCRYAYAYEALTKWQKSKEISSFAEPVLLDYFRELSEKSKRSSLWGMYSMLKSTLISNHNINISGYSRLSAFLKEIGDGCQSKTSKVFTAEDVNKFLTEAPDYKYLAMKIVLVFGVIGSCSIESLTYIKIDHVKDNGNDIIVRIRNLRTKVLNAHAIGGQFAELIRKFIKLRPVTSTTQRFFIRYRNGKCTDHAMGRGYVAKTLKEIAIFLKLPESETYSFRGSSTTISADTGVATETLKLRGQRRHIRIAEEYVQESLGLERQIDNLTTEEINLSSTSSDIIVSHENGSERIATDTTKSSESSSLVNEEISADPLLLSQRVATTDMSDDSLSSENEAPRRKRKKRPKRQKELHWYDEECLAQIKLTTDMFKRFSKLGENEKIKMLNEFSMHRVELFQKYFAAMNTVAINPINTSTTTAASRNISAQNGSVAKPDFLILKVSSLVSTNDINER